MTKFEDIIDDKQRCLAHLRRISKEMDKLIQDFKGHSFGIGDIENRLYWIIRGVDPYQAICSKHNKKITRNLHGEYICGDCVEDYLQDKIPIDETLWFDPDDKPLIKLHGIKYGLHP